MPKLLPYNLPANILDVQFNKLTNVQLNALYNQLGWSPVINKARKVKYLSEKYLNPNAVKPSTHQYRVKNVQSAYDIALRKVETTQVSYKDESVDTNQLDEVDTAPASIPANVLEKIDMLVALSNNVAGLSNEYKQHADDITSLLRADLAKLQRDADKLTDEGIRLRIVNGLRTLNEKFDEAAKDALERAAQNYRPIVVKSPGKKDVKIEGVLPECFDRLVDLGESRIPTMLVGPAGCGKTFIAEKVAEALSLPFYDQSCSEGVSESYFTGWLLPTGDNGKFEYVSAPFIECYENGGVFLLDEIDAADSNLLVFLNKAIANKSFFLPQRKEKPLVKKHKDFQVIAAANTFGSGADAQYVGRNALDLATLDRFRAGTVYMGYSERVEQMLVNPEVLRWGLAIRSQIEANALPRVMSTRVMLDLTKLAEERDWNQQQWTEAYFADWSTNEKRLVSVEGVN